jgi:hypothetical protein
VVGDAVTSTGHVHVYEPEKGGVAILRGVTRELLDSVQIHAMWSPSCRGFAIRKDTVADVIAKLEYARASVHLHAGEPKR